MIAEYDREAKRYEPDYGEPGGPAKRTAQEIMRIARRRAAEHAWEEEAYDSTRPLSIMNHPPFGSMSVRELNELERSFP